MKQLRDKYSHLDTVRAAIGWVLKKDPEFGQPAKVRPGIFVFRTLSGPEETPGFRVLYRFGEQERKDGRVVLLYLDPLRAAEEEDTAED